MVEKTFHWQESQYPGLFCVKPTLKGHTNIALSSPIGFFRGMLRIERFCFTSNSAPIGEDYDQNSDLSKKSSIVAEWPRAPALPPREGGGVGSEPGSE